MNDIFIDSLFNTTIQLNGKILSQNIDEFILKTLKSLVKLSKKWLKKI